MTPPSTSSNVYKVLRAGELATLIADGATEGSPDDRRDGFVHLSQADQVAGTLDRHFAGETGLWLAVLHGAAEGIRRELSRGGSLFPHLYRALRVADVVALLPIPDDGRTAWCDAMPQQHAL